MEVGKRIREERERTGISQEELARQIFVSRQTVSNWETGKTCPDVQSLLLMSNLFDVSVDSLVRGDAETMSKAIENYELERYKIRMSMAAAAGLILLGAVMMAILVARGEDLHSPLYVLAVLVLVASVAVSFIAERIERRYDIDTIREVQAFMEGADPDQISRERRIPKAARIVLKMAAGAAAGVALMMVLSALMSLTMFG